MKRTLNTTINRSKNEKNDEHITQPDNTINEIEYVRGKDISGTLQGAGGVGGLLYLAVDGAIYVPFYDNNGNITRDLDAETAFATKAADVTIQFVCAGWRKILLLL